MMFGASLFTLFVVKARFGSAKPASAGHITYNYLCLKPKTVRDPIVRNTSRLHVAMALQRDSGSCGH